MLFPVQSNTPEGRHLSFLRDAGVDPFGLARDIRFLFLDFDGVLTDNRSLLEFSIPESPGGGMYRTLGKSYSNYDVQGISFLRAIGIKIVIISGEYGDSRDASFAAKTLVEEWNWLPSRSTHNRSEVHSHIIFDKDDSIAKKLQIIEDYQRTNNLSDSEICVMGDDYTDIRMILKAGLSFAPSSAEIDIKERCHGVTIRPGGNGAVRDVANLILNSRDIDPIFLATR